MHNSIRTMMEQYHYRTRDEGINALREILQSLALLGLWRSKFFEHAAFYGGSALRMMYQLDRFSEDLDFSLLKPDSSFSLDRYGEALKREISSFGFQVDFETRKTGSGAINSAFLKASTYRQFLEIEIQKDLIRDLHPDKILKIKLEVDIDPPDGFGTELRYVLQPIPFSVRVYRLPDIFAGKLHAILFRRWKARVKGRDWYDLVWFAGRHPEVNIRHLESRMRQTGDLSTDSELNIDALRELLILVIDQLDIESARRDVAPFLRDQQATDVWSKDFFKDVVARIIPV